MSKKRNYKRELETIQIILDANNSFLEHIINNVQGAPAEFLEDVQHQIYTNDRALEIARHQDERAAIDRIFTINPIQLN